jgi:hypothetical protein
MTIHPLILLVGLIVVCFSPIYFVWIGRSKPIPKELQAYFDEMIFGPFDEGA